MERFSEIYDDYRGDRLSGIEAAGILGCSERHFLRLRGRFAEQGLDGLQDRRVGQVSKRRVWCCQSSAHSSLHDGDRSSMLSDQAAI